MVNTLKNIVMIGFGYVAQHVAKLELKKQIPISTLTRRVEKQAKLNAQEIHCIIGDLDNHATFPTLPLDQAGIYYFAPPANSGQQETRLRHFLKNHAHHHIKRIVYISTTGVYGNTDCTELTSETSPTQPKLDRALRRLDAEHALLAWQQDHPETEVVILRVVGIYGPGKLPIERIKRGEPLLDPSHPSYVNLIHINDLAQACYQAMHYGKPGEVYNISDGNPLLMTHYFQAIATAFNLPQPPLVTMKEAERQLSPGFLSYLKESRRIDNSKMLNQLGVKLLYTNALDAIKKMAQNNCR